MIIIKKISKILISLSLIFSLFFTFSPNLITVHADEIARPNEILVGSKTQTYYYGTQYSVNVTINFTYRFENSNASKKYVTGILGGTVTNAGGWVSVGGDYINRSAASYTQNSQIIYIPFSYNGSIGAGNNVPVSDTFILNMYDFY